MVLSKTKKLAIAALSCVCAATFSLAGCASDGGSTTTPSQSYEDVISDEKVSTADMETEVTPFEVTQTLARPDGEELASYEFCVKSENTGFAATDVIFNLNFTNDRGEVIYETTGIADTILPDQDTYVTGVAYIEGGSQDVANVNVSCDMEGVLWAACSLSPEEIAAMCSVTDVESLDVSEEDAEQTDIVVSGNVFVDRAVYGSVDPEMTSALMANVVALLKDAEGNIVGAGYQNCIVYDLYSETEAGKAALAEQQQQQQQDQQAAEGDEAAEEPVDTGSPFGIRIDDAPEFATIDVVVYPIFRG